MREGYTTLRQDNEYSAEIVEKRSRFIAQLVHVASEQEADDFLTQVRARHHDARHNVPAWILVDGRERCSDDGEPQRTAGMPVLEVLRGAGLADVCCVVTRYFGGTLLGPGGLVRAYTAATQAAVDNAIQNDGIVEMTLVTHVTCVLPYALYGRVERLVPDCSGRVCDTVFAENIQLNCAFRTGEEKVFVDAMRELMAGEDVCTVSTPVFSEF